MQGGFASVPGPDGKPCFVGRVMDGSLAAGSNDFKEWVGALTQKWLDENEVRWLIATIAPSGTVMWADTRSEGFKAALKAPVGSEERINAVSSLFAVFPCPTPASMSLPFPLPGAAQPAVPFGSALPVPMLPIPAPAQRKATPPPKPRTQVSWNDAMLEAMARVRRHAEELNRLTGRKRSAKEEYVLMREAIVTANPAIATLLPVEDAQEKKATYDKIAARFTDLLCKTKEANMQERPGKVDAAGNYLTFPIPVLGTPEAQKAMQEHSVVRHHSAALVKAPGPNGTPVIIAKAPYIAVLQQCTKYEPPKVQDAGEDAATPQGAGPAAAPAQAQTPTTTAVLHVAGGADTPDEPESSEPAAKRQRRGGEGEQGAGGVDYEEVVRQNADMMRVMNQVLQPLANSMEKLAGVVGRLNARVDAAGL
ncbi:unnamed protein product [Pedinophyceae sp. YPF-701]|nr:unnamed protein product [Pedinophyceae sp. YPF-701]